MSQTSEKGLSEFRADQSPGISEAYDSQQDTVKPELAFDFVNSKSQPESETNIAKQVNQIIQNG